MLSITLDTAPGEGGEAPVIKRPKSSEQQPATNPGQAQPAAFQHQHLLINCTSFSYFAGVPKCPPFRIQAECSLTQSSWEMESWTEARWVVGRGLEDDDGS